MQSNKITFKGPDGSTYVIDVVYSYSGTTPRLEGNNWSIYDEWNEWFHNGTPINNKEEKKSSHCWHDWKEYTGFTEHYWYCEKCDEKSKENPNKCF